MFAYAVFRYIQFVYGPNLKIVGNPDKGLYSRALMEDFAFILAGFVVGFIVGLTMDWQLLGLLLIGSLPGIWLGSHFVSRVPERFIRSALSVLLAWAGSKLVFI